MKLGVFYEFEDGGHFHGRVMADELSISLLEAEVKRIRQVFELTKKKEEYERNQRT